MRINFGKSGVGFSFGVKGARVSKSATGQKRATVSVPGTGLTYSKSLNGKKGKSNTKASSTAKAQKNQNGNYAEMSAVRSSEPINLHTVKGWLSLIGGILVILITNPIPTLVGLIMLYILWRVSPALVCALAAMIAAVVAIIVIVNQKHPKEAGHQESGGLNAEAKDSSNKPKKDSNDAYIAQFEAALQAIPRVNIPLSDPAPKHLLKDLPDYSFSNVTRKTRLDSIFPLVFLDVETTGLYPSKSEIVEVSAIRFDSGMVPVSCFTTLCKPSKPIPEEASAINHITDEMVKDAPSFREIAPALTEYLHSCNIAGHNLDFDLRFIFAHGAELPDNKRFYDTLDLAHCTIAESKIFNYKLGTLCNYYRIKRGEAHRSLSDCYATSKVFSCLVYDKTSRNLENNDDTALIDNE